MRRLVLSSLMLASAVWVGAGRQLQARDTWAAPRCDSTNAVKVAIDSLAKIDPFRSKVFRYEHNARDIRIVTMPDTSPRITDGMAIIHVNSRCRITSLVQTDSA
jgi:hypothetical protein